MSSSESQSQEEECPLQDQALQGKQPSLAQPRPLLNSNYSGCPLMNLIEMKPIHGPATIHAYTPVDRPKLGLSHHCTRMASSCLSPNTETSRILSNATHKDTISPRVSLDAAGQPQNVPFDRFSYQLGIQPGASRMATGGSIGINQLNLLDTYMADAFPARDEPAPGV